MDEPPPPDPERDQDPDQLSALAVTPLRELARTDPNSPKNPAKWASTSAIEQLFVPYLFLTERLSGI